MPQENIRQHEDIRRAVDLRLDEIAKRPQDRVALHEMIRAQAALRGAAGRPAIRPVREEIDDEHDFFDNVPV